MLPLGFRRLMYAYEDIINVLARSRFRFTLDALCIAIYGIAFKTIQYFITCPSLNLIHYFFPIKYLDSLFTLRDYITHGYYQN
jgi:hypothetical protein